jgi:hypothetical protein
MKKIILLFSIAFFAIAFSASAQVKETAKKTGVAIKKGAVTAKNKTLEVASKGKSRVTDKVYKGKVTSNGQTVYIDDHARYYWVDKKGHRHYVTEAELRDKPAEKHEGKK